MAPGIWVVALFSDHEEIVLVQKHSGMLTDPSLCAPAASATPRPSSAHGDSSDRCHIGCRCRKKIPNSCDTAVWDFCLACRGRIVAVSPRGTFPGRNTDRQTRIIPGHSIRGECVAGIGPSGSFSVMPSGRAGPAGRAWRSAPPARLRPHRQIRPPTSYRAPRWPGPEWRS